MIQREDIRKGLLVRLLSDHLHVPQGTLATVETVSIIGSAKEFCFTVRWLNLPCGTRSRPISDRSLNLWLTDLEKFECVSKEDAEGILAAGRPTHPRKRPGCVGSMWSNPEFPF